MPCRDYQPTRQFCPICRTTGHRPDVCPNPTVRACNTCNHPNPEAGHTCVPKCALCGGAHLTATKDCNNKLKRIRPRGKPASTTAPKTQRHPRPRWFSSEREDSDSDYSESSMTYRSRSGSSPRSRSRSCSRPRPHFRSPRRRSQSTSKQQQQGAPIIAAPKDKGSQQNQRKTKEASPKSTNTKEQEWPWWSSSLVAINVTGGPRVPGCIDEEDAFSCSLLLEVCYRPSFTSLHVMRRVHVLRHVFRLYGVPDFR
ncbi:hypothetical protein HPB49_011640 [Dermacentor silvarum]|uniref:Uncharacterized protein n=1 Tax=Dermacentor silvarum TaxID=543639 RepID=A0ACB8CR62_DERSI|nr:hypothetical protein HPB49_011640 [Dermacentor silvarum]